MNQQRTAFGLLVAMGAVACQSAGTTPANRQTPAGPTSTPAAPTRPAPAPAAPVDPPTRKDLMHRQNVFAAALSGDGSRIVTGSVGGEVLVWSTAGLVPIVDLPATSNRGKIAALALSADGREALIAPDWKPTIERWDVDGRAVRGELAAHSGRTTALAYAPTGGLIATAGADRVVASGAAGGDDAVPKTSAPVVRLWNGDAKVRELAGLTGRIGAIAFDRDGARIAAAGDDAVKVWSTKDGRELASYALPGEAAAVGFRGDDVCAVSSKGAACFGAHGAVAVDGARAPTRAAVITPTWIASGTYDAVEVRAVDGALKATVPGRAYAVVGAGDELWAILADSVVPVRAGVAAPAVMLKLPAK